MNIIERLKRLESISPKPMIILANFDGVERECTLDELEQNANACFIKVLDGGTVDDVQRILNRTKAEA